jgi:hypothetical protein
LSKAEKYSSKIVSYRVEKLIFLTMFTAAIVFFKSPFEFYFHYIIFLALLPLFMLKYRFPKLILQVMTIPFIVGIINVSIENADQFSFIKVFGGLLLTLLFYQYVMLYYDFNVKRLFRTYVKWCYWIALIGLVQQVSYVIGFTYGYDYSWLLNKWGITPGGILGIRLNSIISEPSGLAVVMMPAVYVALYNLLRKETFIINKKQSLIILLVLILTSSSTGLIGLIVAFMLASDTLNVRYIAIGVAISIGGGYAAYYNIDEFRSRVDTSIGLWIDDDFKLENTNSSSFVLYNNLHVAAENLKEHTLFGTGLGSHEIAYEKYSLTNTVVLYDFSFNTKDGNSMLIRLLSETGLLGAGFVLLILFRSFVHKNRNSELNEYRIVSQGLFILIFVTLLRQGNYMLNGFPLIMLMYYYTKKEYAKRKNELLQIDNEPNELGEANA